MSIIDSLKSTLKSLIGAKTDKVVEESKTQEITAIVEEKKEEVIQAVEEIKETTNEAVDAAVAQVTETMNEIKENIENH